MKILAIPINTIVVFREHRRPMPYRFKFEDKDGEICDIIVDKIFSIEEKKTAGIITYNYLCQSMIGGLEKQYELKYILKDARWKLYKM